MNNDSFISGSMEGVAEAPSVTSEEIKEERKQRFVELYTKTIENRVSPKTYVRDAYSNILADWYNKPPADTQAIIVGRDFWGRKIEAHAPGWEQTQGIVRQFNTGDYVTLKHGVNPSTFLPHNEYGDDATYIWMKNEVDEIERIVSEVRKLPIDPESQAPQVQGGIQAVIVGSNRLTVNKFDGTSTPVYEVEVVEGVLNGLRLLEYPDQVEAVGV